MYIQSNDCKPTHTHTHTHTHTLVWSPVHSKERSGDWASQRSEHWNVEGGANVAVITFSWACGTHGYKTMATCNCTICGSNLPSCKERRVLYSRESCHVVSTAVELLHECVPHVSVTNLERSLLKSTTTSYICKRPCFTSLERIQRLEREAVELRNSLKEKLKVTHRAELRKRHETAKSSSHLDDTVGRTALVAATPAKSALFLPLLPNVHQLLL